MMIAFCMTATTALGVADTCATDYVVLEPCTYEDSLNCYWAADVGGNLQGQSFVDVAGRYFTWDGKASGMVGETLQVTREVPTEQPDTGPDWFLIATTWSATAPPIEDVIDGPMTGLDCITAAEGLTFATQTLTCELAQ